MVFSVAAIALVGMVSLGTEVANRYLERAGAQNAANSAAVAAALAAANAIAAGDGDAVTQTAAEDAASDSATRNNFTSSSNITVTANYPPVSGSHTSTAGATEVLVSTTLTPILAGLVNNSTSVTINTRAVGLVTTTGQYACVLATLGELHITGSQTSSNCSYASNYSDASNAMVIDSIASVIAYGASAVGGWTNNGTATLVRPAAMYQPPTTNPYSPIDSLPSTWSLTCPSTTFPANSATTVLSPGVYCAANIPSSNLDKTTTPNTFNITSGGWELHPGTYYFKDLSLSITGGVVACVQTTGELCSAASAGTQGVTLVFTGSTNVGSLTINPDSTSAVQLPAEKTNSSYSQLNGMLFYRDINGSSGSNSSPVVNINENNATAKLTVTETANQVSVSSALTGGMYFPKAYVTFGGNASSGCTIVVAGYPTVPAATINQQYCSSYLGTNMPQLQAAQLVE